VDPERLRGVAEILAAVRRGDVDGVVRALPLAGSTIPDDDSDLRRELRETLGSLGGPLWREHSLEKARNAGLEAIRRGGARLHVEVDQMADFLVEAERLGGGRQTRIATAAEAAEVLISRYRNPAYVASRLARRVAQSDALADYPRQVHALLDELKDGEVEVRFRHAGLDELISKVDILANRLVFALLIAALIIGSSMLGIFSCSSSVSSARDACEARCALRVPLVSTLRLRPSLVSQGARVYVALLFGTRGPRSSAPADLVRGQPRLEALLVRLSTKKAEITDKPTKRACRSANSRGRCVLQETLADRRHWASAAPGRWLGRLS
jgi:hypothetical protein